MPCDCSCVSDEVPGADSFVKLCWRGVKTPSFRPFPTTSGCMIKNAAAQCSLPKADGWCRPRGYPIRRGWAAKWLSHRHHCAWGELRKMAQYSTIYSLPATLIERHAGWSSFRCSLASSCLFFLSPMEQVSGLTREEGKRRMLGIFKRKQATIWNLCYLMCQRVRWLAVC